MIAPGHHLYRGPDQRWRYSAPDDMFVRVDGDDRLLETLQRLEHTDRPDGSDQAGDAPPDGDVESLDRMRTALTERGVLAGAEDPAAEPGRAWRVRVLGRGPVADTLGRLLGDADRTGDMPCDETTVATCELLISCATWLPDRDWQQIDDWCRRHGTLWHRCHWEGTELVIGPLSVPGVTASYRDTRGRRLAAAGLPDELLAHWAYLDSDAPTPAAPGDVTAAAVAAGLIAADVQAVRDGRPAPSAGHQLVFDPSSARLTRHPVLPLPRLAGATPDRPPAPNRLATNR